jgi:ribosome-associated protein
VKELPISDHQNLSGQPNDSSERLLQLIVSSLEDDKATDLVVVPLAGKSSIADYMVIASGTSSRQLSAMAEHLGKAMKDHGITSRGTEGAQQGDWILIDAGDIIVHLFRPEVREFYQLEKMWLDSTDASRPAIETATP